MRTASGTLIGCHEYRTNKIPSIVMDESRGQSSWDYATSIAFTGSLLSWMKKIISTEGDGVWSLKYVENGRDVYLQKKSDAKTGFLNPEFVSWRTEDCPWVKNG